MKFLEGKKTKITAVMMLLGGLGLLVNGQTDEGVGLLLAAATAFGLGDKVDRLAKGLKGCEDCDNCSEKKDAS